MEKGKAGGELGAIIYSIRWGVPCIGVEDRRMGVIWGHLMALTNKMRARAWKDDDYASFNPPLPLCQLSRAYWEGR